MNVGQLRELLNGFDEEIEVVLNQYNDYYQVPQEIESVYGDEIYVSEYGARTFYVNTKWKATDVIVIN